MPGAASAPAAMQGERNYYYSGPVNVRRGW